MSTIPAPPPLSKPPSLTKPPPPAIGTRGLSNKASADSAGGTQNSSVGTVNRRTMVPSPYLDLADYSVPDTPHQIYEMCRYFAATSAPHRAYVRNFSSLPATPILVSAREGRQVSEALHNAVKGTSAYNQNVAAVGSTDSGCAEWADFLDKKIRIRSVLKEFGANACTFSAAVVTLHRPFRKVALCQSCEAPYHMEVNEDGSADWHFEEGYRTIGFTCKSCNSRNTRASVRDEHYQQSVEGVRAVVLDMENIRAIRNDITGDLRVYYVIPDYVREMMRVGMYTDYEMMLQYPQSYLVAAANFDSSKHNMITGDKPAIRLREGEFFLWKSASPTRGHNGLPLPDFLATFKETWLMRLMEKSQEAISTKEIIPLTVLFPNLAAGGDTDLYQMVQVANYMPALSDMLEKHTRDPNYRAVMPFPIGSHTIGGEGRQLMLHQEIRALMEIICAALGCPIDFLFGGMSYSGSNVSVKQVMTQLHEMQVGMQELAQWISDKLVVHLNRSMSYEIKMSELRIGDDLAYVQMLSGLAGGGQVSMQTLHDEMRINHGAELDRIRSDQEFQNTLNRDRAKLDAQAQNELMLAQANATGRGAAHQQMAEVKQKVDNARQIRQNPDLLNYVLSDPAMAASLLGTGAPDVSATHGTINQNELPYPIDPSVPVSAVAMDKQMDVTSLDEPDEPKEPDVLQQASVDPSVVSSIISQMSEFERTDWPAMVATVRNELGDEYARAVSTELSNVAAEYMIAQPEQRAGQRNAAMST